MRTKTPDQAVAEYNWLTPSEVAPMIGAATDDAVRALIRDGHLEAMDVSRSSKPRYRISKVAVEAFIEESKARVSG